MSANTFVVQMLLGRCGPLGLRTRYRQEYPKMATDSETTRKLPLNRRDAVKAIAFGAAGVTLAA